MVFITCLNSGSGIVEKALVFIVVFNSGSEIDENSTGFIVCLRHRVQKAMVLLYF